MSPGVQTAFTRFDAADSNATTLPAPLIAGRPLAPFPAWPVGLTLRQLVVFAFRSRT